MSKILLALILFIFFWFYFFISLPYYSGDVNNHIVWGRSILNEGLLGFYDREFHDYSFPNYPPVSMFLFALSVVAFDSSLSLAKYLNQTIPIFPSNVVPFLEWENVLIAFLKLPATIPALGIALWFYLILDHLKKNATEKFKLFHILIFLLNPAIIYLAAVWGQNDLLQNMFILFAFYFLITKKPLLSSVFGALAILSKQTILVIWVLYMLTFLKLYGFKKTLIGGLITALIVYLFYLPFNNNSLLWPFEFYIKTLSVSTGFLVSDNAINFWGSVFDYRKIDAAEKISLLSWEKWGFVLFLITVSPLIYLFWKKKFSLERLFQFLFASSLCYFFFLTRMHERYLIPAVLFASVLVIFKRIHWLNYIFFSILFFINLYRGLLQPEIPILNMILKTNYFLHFLVIIYAGILIFNYYLFLKQKA